MRVSSLRIVPLGLLVALSACSSSPLERPETTELRSKPPLPRTLSLRVEWTGQECFGSRAVWAEELVRVLRELKCCTAVRAPPAVGEGEADLSVVVSLERTEPGRAEVIGQGALLDFLAWSTVPVLPWWIRDVKVDPGLRVRLRRKLLFQESPAWREVVSEYWNVPPIPTSLRERYPFFSWPTLGALLLPPFVFQAGDFDHFARCQDERMRLEVAVEVAKIIKRSDLEGEFLKNLRITDGPVGLSLVCDAEPEVGALTLRLEPSSTGLEVKGVEELPGLRRPGPERQVLPLGKLLEAAPGARLLRVEAKNGEGQVQPYSLLIPAADAAAPSPEAP